MLKFSALKASLTNALAHLTVRLRILLVVIGVVTAITGLVAILQVGIILAAYTELNYSAQPMLQLAKRIENNTQKLSLRLQSFTNFSQSTGFEDPVEATSDQADQIIEQAERLRENLAELKAYDVPENLIHDFDMRLAAARTSVISTLDTRDHYLRLKEELRHDIHEILSLHNKSQQLLESFTFNITSQSDRLMRDLGTSSRERERINEQLAKTFQMSLNINSMGFALDTVVAAANNASDLGGNAPSNRSILETREELRDIVVKIALLPDTQERLELVQYVARLRGLVIGPNGIFAHQLEQYELRQEFDRKRLQHLPLLSDISETVAQLVNRSLEIVDKSTTDLWGALQNLISVLITALFVSLSVILFTNWAIIERQFRKRIQILNRAVRAIASGDLDHPVPVTGIDELGEMASALTIFKQNAIELQRSNIELEKFAYVAAHDLRSPLRAISDLSSWIIEDEENKLSIESSAYFTLMQERTNRLDRLLCDLLAYARAGENDPEIETIDLSACIRDQIQYANPNGTFDISYHGPDVLIKTHLTPLQQVLSNLLSNAVRHHDKKKGCIAITAEVWPNQLTLVLTDDGPGIEVQYQERIFELFQTLQPRDDVEGSGLGLAIVKKIVERNKGSITLTSDPRLKRGTTFTVTFPLPEKPVAIAPKQARTAA